MYLKILFLIHIAGAIVGFGPTFAFGILGGRQARSDLQPARGLVIMEAILAINRSLVYPVGFVVQPVSGALLIFATHRNEGFFQHEWLVIAIVLYLAMLALVLFVDAPALRRMDELGRAGRVEDPEYQRLGKRAATLGPMLGLLITAIIVLMVLKPGD